MQKSLSPERKLERAKVQLLRSQPFFGRPACDLKWIIQELEIPTAATDGRRILFHPEFLDSLDDDELIFVTAHEVEHVIKKHQLRRGERNPQLWNIACDHNINLELTDNKIGQVPEKLKGKIFCDERFRGMLEERIYEQLMSEMSKEEQDALSMDPGGCGAVIDSEAVGKGEAAMTAEHTRVNRVIEAAAQYAKQCGKMPGFMQDFCNKNLEPQINWKGQLRRFIEPLFPTDVSWSRPNRRTIYRGMYMPGAIKDGTGKIAVGLDTSGSISQKELEVFFAELKSIFSETKPEMLIVYWFESHIWRVDHVPRGIDFPFPEKIKTGGTHFQAVFDKIEEDAENPRCLIMLTDMYDSFPSQPGYPVIWCATTDIEAPYGHTIRVDI